MKKKKKNLPTRRKRTGGEGEKGKREGFFLPLEKRGEKRKIRTNILSAK